MQINAGLPWHRRSAYWVLCGAVLVVSTSSILIRFAQAEGVSAGAIAFWRLFIASLVLLLWVGAREPVGLGAAFRDRWLPLSGVFLGIHFAAWIASLFYTSVASSTALVTTIPVWVALASWLLFGERPTLRVALGIAAAMAGSACFFYAGEQPDSAGSNPTLGNMLAILGSWAVCGYMLIGRKRMQTHSTGAYVAAVYSVAAITLLVFALVSGDALWGYSAVAWWCLIGLAAGPQLLGHTGINWALARLTPTMVSVVILAEPVGSTVFAFLFLGEAIGLWQIVGFVFLAVGIVTVSRAPAPLATPLTPKPTAEARRI
ncbi:MAG: DMT family transporter [Burkholderiales bacterium]